MTLRGPIYEKPEGWMHRMTGKSGNRWFKGSNRHGEQGAGMRSTFCIEVKIHRVRQKQSTGNQQEASRHVLKQHVHSPAAVGYIKPANEGGAKENPRARKGQRPVTGRGRS